VELKGFGIENGVGTAIVRQNSPQILMVFCICFSKILFIYFIYAWHLCLALVGIPSSYWH